MTRVRVPLSEQIANAERIRNSLRELRDEGVEYDSEPPIQQRLDAQEATCLTLAMLQNHEQEFRRFMAKHSRDAA